MPVLIGVKHVAVQQIDVDLNVAPASGVPETILATTANIRVIGLAVRVTWTVQPTPLELFLTIDGITYTASQTDPVSATVYRVFIDENLANVTLRFSTTSQAPSKAFLIEGRSIGITAEITGGTVQNMRGKLIWARIQ